MKSILCLLLGYVIGNINPSYILSRLKGFDIRNTGSGNAGASNVVLMMGKVAGAVCAFFDVFKAYFAYKAASILFPSLIAAGILAGGGCILGHIFPVWMNFAGGKGLACLGGLILAYNWKLFFIMLTCEIILLCFIDYIAVMTITVAGAFPVIYWFQTGELAGTLLLAVIAVIVFLKHCENLKRICEGAEVRVLHFLINKKGEVERLKDKYPNYEG